MSTSSKVAKTKPANVAVGLVVGRDDFTVCLEDGRRVSIPYTRFPRLERATPDQRRHFEVRARGRMLHWPEVDEDIEVQHLLEGRLPSQAAARAGMVAEDRATYGARRKKR